MQTAMAVGTEGYILQEERSQQAWQQNYAAREQEYLKQIDA